MHKRVTEIADAIHQLTTYVADMDFGFNQYLVSADEPLLLHRRRPSPASSMWPRCSRGATTSPRTGTTTAR